MTNDKRERILRDAVSTYGETAQITKAIEELCELSHALCRYQNALLFGKLDELHVRDVHYEMADVQIMLDQLRLMFGDCAEEETFKLERLARILALPR